MKSMTGYGFAEIKRGGLRLTAEISSVNKKGLDLTINLPRQLASLEARLRELVQKKLTRGRVVVNVDVAEANKKTPQLPIREDVLKAHQRALQKLARKLRCSDELPLPFLLTLPGVMNGNKEAATAVALQRVAEQAVLKALDDFIRARKREGDFLCQQLGKMTQGMGAIVERIEKANPQIVERYRRGLMERIQAAGVPLEVNDEKLLKELAFFADRSDVTEEITRLRSHLQEAARLLRGEDAAGRRLDFLIQEIQREINTIGSKANGLEISQHVIAFKTDLEKIREQVQNLE
ncbi:MAG: YicC/YloC family endoribonuclease [bacterium]